MSILIAILRPRMSYDQHFEYLRNSIESNQSEQGGQKSIHGLVKELNAITGLYWIVGSWKLLESLADDPPKDTDKMNAKFKYIFNSLIRDRRVIIPNEDGGLLRSYSLVQLSLMLGTQQDEVKRISSETVLMLEKFHQSKTFPFWFDMRSIYCLLGILKSTKQTIPPEIRSWLSEWILSCQSILGGFGANPKAEPHSGYTYCAVSSLIMLGHGCVPNQQRLVAWLRSRLSPRFNGRPGKPSDSCYIWWNCATLRNLRSDLSESAMMDVETKLVSNFSSSGGGFSKYPSVPIPDDDSSVHGKQEADLFHSFLGFCSLALFRNIIDSICVLPT